jgi:hypothetical protein
MTPERHYRCRFCGHLLPAWLPVAKRPESAVLLNHLVAMHPAQARPYFTRMERECIDAVLMEMYEVVKEGVDRLAIVITTGR